MEPPGQSGLPLLAVLEALLFQQRLMMFSLMQLQLGQLLSHLETLVRSRSTALGSLAH
jgi:hypothetical protein